MKSILPIAVSLFAAANLSSDLYAQCDGGQVYSLLGNPIDVMGWSVDLDLDRAAVSYIGDDYACPTNPNCNAGAVNMYARIGEVWGLSGRLQALDGAAGDEFGQDVDISGDRVVVGAHFKGAGAAYVFVFNGNNWVQEQKLEGSSAVQADHFGHSVTMVGDSLIVGAMRDGHAGLESGASYVFERFGGTWQETNKLTASNAESGARYGRATIGRANMFLVAALRQNGTGANQGAVYVYERNEMGTPANPLDDTWPETQILTSSTPADDANFGTALALDGDLMLVGAPAAVVGGIRQGQVTVYERVGGLWVETQTLQAGDAQVDDGFGQSVALQGDRILVGAMNEDEGGNNAGAVYVFERTSGLFVQTNKIVAVDANPGAGLGHEMGVALDGSQAVIGARFHNGGNNLQGTAYFFDLAGCLGTRFCSANPNTTGLASLLKISGSTLADGNNLTLTAPNLPLGQFGIFLVGQAPGFVPNAGGSMGNLCLGGAIGRYNQAGQISNSGTAGSISLNLDLTQTPQPSGGPVPIMAGQTWYFQAWYRDFQPMLGSISNLSDGVGVTFQ